MTVGKHQWILYTDVEKSCVRQRSYHLCVKAFGCKNADDNGLDKKEIKDDCFENNS